MTSKNLRIAGLFAAALFTTVAVSRYLSFSPAAYFSEQHDTYVAHPVGLYTHILGGLIATLLGPIQFVPGLRNRFLRAHRWTGRLYAAAVLFGGLAGLYMSRFAFGGIVAGAGFAMLALTWIGCTATAVLHAMNHRLAEHREWMIRSFTLTLAAFSLRVLLLIHGIAVNAGLTTIAFVDAYVAIAWLCWIPNLIIAEVYLRRSRRQVPVGAMQPADRSQSTAPGAGAGADRFLRARLSNPPKYRASHPWKSSTSV